MGKPWHNESRGNHADKERTMPLERIDGDGLSWVKTCRHPEHSPPTMIVLQPGTYRHICPACGNQVVFVVGPGPTLGEVRPGPYGWKVTCSA